MPGEKQVKNYTGNIPVMAITLLAIGLLLWAALDAYQRYQYHQQWQFLSFALFQFSGPILKLEF